MKKYYITLLLLGIIFNVVFPLKGFSEDTSGSQEMKKIMNQEVKEICSAITSQKCSGDCLDGCSSVCYFDAKQYKTEDINLLPCSESESAQKKCFALHFSSVCSKPCFNKFEVRKEGELKEVSCEEFYSLIKERNKSCDNCIGVRNSFS